MQKAVDDGDPQTVDDFQTAALKSEPPTAMATFKCVQGEGSRFERKEKRAADIGSPITPCAPAPEELEACEDSEEVQVEGRAPQNEHGSSGYEDVDMGRAAGGNYG